MRRSPPPARAARLALGLIAATLTGCWPDTGPDFHGVTPDPADLSVRQSPSSPVRAGDTITFTAVFKDSLNPKWLYNWSLNDNGAVPFGGRERSIRWAPPMPGSYIGRVYVTSGNSRSTLSFRTTVLP